ncbi:hypothetical protein Trydic_g10461 [Trypoxylus dichotomus]
MNDLILSTKENIPQLPDVQEALLLKFKAKWAVISRKTRRFITNSQEQKEDDLPPKTKKNSPIPPRKGKIQK